MTALAVWDPSQPCPQAHAAADIERGEGPAAAAAAAEAGVGREGGPPGSPRSYPIAVSPDSPSLLAAAAAAVPAAAAAARAGERPWGGFVVVGTTIGGPEEDVYGEPRWDDETSSRLQGRLLLLQLVPAAATPSSAAQRQGGGWDASPFAAAPPQRRLQLLPAAEMHLPSRVLALCPGHTSLTGAHDGGGSSRAVSRLFASVGRRLVALEWRQGQQLLRRTMWVPTNRPVRRLEVRPAAGLPGIFHALGFMRPFPSRCSCPAQVPSPALRPPNSPALNTAPLISSCPAPCTARAGVLRPAGGLR